MWSKQLPAWLSLTGVLLGPFPHLEKLRVAVGLFNPLWTTFPTTCNLMSLYQLALCYYINWTQTVFPAHVMLLSMTLCRFGIFPRPSFHAQPQLSTNPSLHILLPTRFHRASPTYPFIIHSAIKSNICLAGEALTGTENKTSKAQSFSRTFQDGRKALEY